MKVYWLVRESDLSEWTGPYPSKDHALVALSRDVGLDLEFCEGPNAFHLEEGEPGQWRGAGEKHSVRLRRKDDT